MNTYIFMYLLEDDIDTIKKAIGSHIKYWRDRELDYYRGGPFADKSGGLIIFTSSSYETANNIIAKDPFLTEKVLKEYWLKEWIP